MTQSSTLVTLLALSLLLACQSRPSTNETTDQSAPTTTQTTGTQCYAFVSAQDTIRLSVTTTDSAVTGDLVYRLSGKDQNTGTIRGRMIGDTLLAEYVFQSEGVESVREVAFLKQADGFAEGYGPVEERNARMIFSNRALLTFNKDLLLSPVVCPQ